MELAFDFLFALALSIGLIALLNLVYRRAKPNALGAGCIAATLIIGAIILVIVR